MASTIQATNCSTVGDSDWLLLGCAVGQQTLCNRKKAFHHWMICRRPLSTPLMHPGNAVSGGLCRGRCLCLWHQMAQRWNGDAGKADRPWSHAQDFHLEEELPEAPSTFRSWKHLQNKRRKRTHTKEYEKSKEKKNERLISQTEMKDLLLNPNINTLIIRQIPADMPKQTVNTEESIFHSQMQENTNLLSKQLEFRRKYSPARCIFNSLLGVWKCRQAQTYVFDYF